jgi:hypothetical protein
MTISIKFTFGDFHISIQLADLVATIPISLLRLGAEAIVSHSQYERQLLQLLGSVHDSTTTVRISYAGHSSCSLAPCSNNHRSLHTSGQVSLELADVVVLERVGDHVT